MSTLERDGLTLSTFERGHGPTVVFQHGLGGDKAQTNDAVPLGFRLLTLECRGHGASQVGELDALSIPTFAEDVIAMIEAKADGPVVLGGISMGAAISARIAVSRPDLVRCLILTRPAWVAEDAPKSMEPNAYVGRLLAQMPLELARISFENSELGLLLQIQSPDNYASLMGYFNKTDVSTIAQLLMRISDSGPGITKSQLAALTCPTLIIGTEQDAIHPLAFAEALHGIIQHSQLEIITPKGVDRTQHMADLHRAISAFILGLTP